MIPKVDNPEVFEEFRPISLCNVLVKKISIILANRLREVLDELVGPHQSAFIKGRNISENILLAHELVRNFHRDKGTPKFCAKLDIRKAYDSVPWDAVLNTLESLKFPRLAYIRRMWHYSNLPRQEYSSGRFSRTRCIYGSCRRRSN